MASAAHLRRQDRIPKRTRVLMTGTLFTPEGAQNVRIRDISPDGAQILAEAPVPHGCDAIFKRGAIFAAARVVWSNERETGLRFYRNLSPADVESVFNPAVLGVAGGG